jgi:hypothetical protein
VWFSPLGKQKAGKRTVNIVGIAFIFIKNVITNLVAIHGEGLEIED